MATANKIDVKLLPPFYPPDGPEAALVPEYELPDSMHQGPHIHEAGQSAWREFFRRTRPDELPPLVGDTDPMYYRDALGRRRLLIPDLFFAFNVNANAIYARNAYFVDEVGKAPEVIFEVGSRSTYDNDLGDKRELYLWLGVLEYWGFDATGGDYYGAPLFGLILVNGEYVEVEVEYDEATGVGRAYSPMLDMYVCVERNADPRTDDDKYRMRFQDRRTGEYLRSPRESEDAYLSAYEELLESETELRESETARGWLESELNIERAALRAEREARQAAERREQSERAARRSEREAAQAQIRELQDRLRRYEPEPDADPPESE